MKTIIDCLNANSGAIQAIMVITLVIVTIWYAKSTKDMATLMHQEYKLHSRPYLVLSRDITRNFIKGNNKVIQLKFLFNNVSNVPVEYYIDELTLDQKSVKPPKVNTSLFPQQNGALFSNLYESKVNLKNGDGLKGSIKIIFWTQENIQEKYYFQRDFELVPGGNAFILSESFGKI